MVERFAKSIKWANFNPKERLVANNATTDTPFVIIFRQREARDG